MSGDIASGLSALDQQQNANPFWRELLKSDDLGYRSPPLQGGSNREDPAMLAALAAADRIRELSAEISTQRFKLGKSELPIHVLWLQDNGIFDELMDFLDAQGLRFQSTATRWYLYARKLAKLSKRHVGRSASILEIGAGAGELACFAYAMRRWRRYIVVDLPPMLANLHRNLSRRMPEAVFALNAWPEQAAAPQIVLLDPAHADLIPDDAADIGLNFNSFMEMDDGVRDRYIALIYRAVRPGGLFWNVNRRQPKMTRLDGSVFDNHPLRYPYRADDEVLEIDLDFAQQDVRSTVGRSYRRMPISRIARVKPAQAAG